MQLLLQVTLLVLLNVLKQEIIVIGTPGILMALLLVLFIQEYVLQELLSLLLIHIKRCKCAIGLMQQRFMIRVTVKTVMI
jgi:hypothetical protein